MDNASRTTRYSTFEPDDVYGDGVSIIGSPSSPNYSDRRRRFSEASGVLPSPDLSRNQISSGSSQRSRDDYGQVHYHSPGGLPTPPLNSTQSAVSMLETLQLNPPSRTSSIAPSTYYPVSETDDPAVIRTFPEPPHGAYPSPAPSTLGVPSIRSPVRSTTSHSGWSPTQPTQLQTQIQTHMPAPQPYRTELPSLPYICAFENKQYGQMILKAPENWTDQTPLYYIEVHPNCFMPTSFITSVFRGGGQRELLARFEMGISRGQPTVFMGQQLFPMSEVFFKFRKVNSRLRDRWTWQRAGCKLHWDCRNEAESVCWHENDPDHTPIARIKPASAQPPGSMSTRPPATRLELYVQSPQLADEIVVSALIVERKRLSPADGSKNEDLFN